jgi:hypothetical protein
MIDFNKFQRSATAAVGAIVISAACVGAAIGPAATAGTPSTVYAAVQAPASAQALNA